uniref:Uncharacterized protein n=1 Tax=Prochlorococcus marinus str. P0902-H212 TaxID=1620696 RepID=A0A0D5A2X5_PROMR|nr:hypothetical protein FA02_0267 [Prochlorococcus marinus str. P0902-H212]
MNQHPSNKTKPKTRQIHFWIEGKIPSSAYQRIRRHQIDKKKDYEKAMLSEWIV